MSGNTENDGSAGDAVEISLDSLYSRIDSLDGIDRTLARKGRSRLLDLDAPDDDILPRKLDIHTDEHRAGSGEPGTGGATMPGKGKDGKSEKSGKDDGKAKLISPVPKQEYAESYPVGKEPREESKGVRKEEKGKKEDRKKRSFFGGLRKKFAAGEPADEKRVDAPGEEPKKEVREAITAPEVKKKPKQAEPERKVFPKPPEPVREAEPREALIGMEWEEKEAPEHTEPIVGKKGKKGKKQKDREKRKGKKKDNKKEPVSEREGKREPFTLRRFVLDKREKKIRKMDIRMERIEKERKKVTRVSDRLKVRKEMASKAERQVIDNLAHTGIELAPLYKRSVAYIIDIFFISIITLVILIILNIPGGWLPVFMLVSFMYFSINHCIFGRGFGKMFMNIYLVTLDFKYVPFMNSIGHAFFSSVVPWSVVDGIYALTYPLTKQSISNRLTGTIVINGV